MLRGCKSAPRFGDNGILREETNPKQGAPIGCYHLRTPSRIHITFDDHRLVNDAGLILPAILADRLGLRELVNRHIRLGRVPGRANAGDKMPTLVASALSGGDCIDDSNTLRVGRTAGVLGFVVKAPSTVGTFMRGFRWGHARQLDRVSRELPARAWDAVDEAGDGPLTIDLDSTVCETYGLKKEGGASPRLHRSAGLPSAAGRGRRHGRGADGPTA